MHRNLQATCALVVLGILVMLVACAGQPVDERPWTLRTAERLETSLSPERIRLAPREAKEDLERALELFALVDNQHGQARCHLKLARLYLGFGDGARASGHLESAERIAGRLGSAPLRYESLLLKARLSDKTADYQRALAFARTPVQKAVVQTYLDQPGVAYQTLRPHLDEAGEAPEDYAFVLYGYARMAGDLDVARKALDLYKHADNPPGIAASLYLMGRIARDREQPTDSRGYFERALVVARASRDLSLAKRIEKELNAF
jgi:tetratricopeptide (TPR) repeat protein